MPQLRDSIIEKAKNLGVNPHDLATAIAFESGFRSNAVNPDGKHAGLIQFGPAEQRKYGVSRNTDATTQMDAVESFLRDRGVKPGMGMLDLYSTINAGSPGHYGAKDGATTVAQKVNSQMAGARKQATALLGGEFTPSATGGGAGAASGGAARAGSSYTADNAPADETIFAKLAGAMGEQTNDPRRLELRKIMADVLDHPDVQALIPQQTADAGQQASPSGADPSPSGGFAPVDPGAAQTPPLPPARPEGIA